MPATESQVVLLTEGLGGARLAPSLRDALGPGRLTVIANVGDDLTWHGVRVCPDLDSVAYTDWCGITGRRRSSPMTSMIMRVSKGLAVFRSSAALD
jgi:2-phospho-L-lactate transferase/gluconeogenesis factor (CofD/UPF0052 family)